MLLGSNWSYGTYSRAEQHAWICSSSDTAYNIYRKNSASGNYILLCEKLTRSKFFDQ